MAERDVPEGLIPHRGPARLVQTILDDARTDVLVCGGRIPADSAFAVGGRAPAVMVLELAAQAAAVQQALAGPTGAAARPGYLVAVRAAIVRVDDVAANVPLVATVRRTGQAGPLATYDVTVNGPGGQEILTATLSTHAGD
jgi:predicted hotdog family 3-hydroxylacyl-ACP dehydratase